MSGKKWIMKQYWRVGTIRTLFSLVLSMLVLGKYYYEFVPILAPLGLLGALILGFLLVLLFLGIGYIYDVRLKLWNETFQVGVERDPYQQTPNIRSYSMDFPVLYAFLLTFRKSLLKRNLDFSKIDELVQYYDAFFHRNATEKNDLVDSIKSNEAFLDRNPFTKERLQIQKGRSKGARMKKSFQTQILRINYVQSLTGSVQDVLVISALYVPILFGATLPRNLLLNMIWLISLPLFILLVVLGWYYDKQLRMWGPEFSVRIERDPYSYVPEPKLVASFFPFIYAFLSTSYDVLNEINSDTRYIEKIIGYFDSYSALRSSVEDDMNRGKQIRFELGNIWMKQNGEDTNGS